MSIIVGLSVLMFVCSAVLLFFREAPEHKAVVLSDLCIGGMATAKIQCVEALLDKNEEALRLCSAMQKLRSDFEHCPSRKNRPIVPASLVCL